MQWESWSAFWAMGGSAVFVWGSYGLFLALIIIELLSLRLGRKAVMRSLLRIRKTS